MAGLGNVLVINSGSSSVKYRFYEGEKAVIDGTLDLFKEDIDYSKATEIILKKLKNKKIDKIAHRVVYSGQYTNHVVITDSVIKNLKQTFDLDPMHMPAAVALIELFSKLNVKQIACFDTVFHETMPPVAKYYAIPWKLTQKYDIKRYGFHGLSHQFLMQQGRKFGSKIITCHLGNGISLCAIKDGECIDTSMGFTPLEGIMMGTRSGSIDPSLVAFISKKEKISADKVVEILNKESGLKGIAGDADVRNLLKRKDVSAKLALDMLCYQIRKQIGAYTMALDGLDVIVFGGGISNSKEFIKRIMQNECMKDIKSVVVNTDEEKIMYEISQTL